MHGPNHPNTLLALLLSTVRVPDPYAPDSAEVLDILRRHRVTLTRANAIADQMAIIGVAAGAYCDSDKGFKLIRTLRELAIELPLEYPAPSASES